MIRWATAISKVIANKKSVAYLVVTTEDKNTVEKLARRAYLILVIMILLLLVRLPFAIIGLGLTLLSLFFKWLDEAVDWIAGKFLGLDAAVDYSIKTLEKR